MAVVIPVVMAFASAAQGVALVAAAASTLSVAAGYAMVAGAVLSGVGAVTGDKDLMKVGGILSLAGGVGSAVSSMTTAAGEVAAQEAGKQALEESVGDKLARDAMTDQLVSEMSGAAATDAAANAATQATASTVESQLTGTLGNLGQAGAGGSLTPLSQEVAGSGGAGALASSASPVQQAVTDAGITAADVAGSASSTAAATGGGGFNLIDAGRGLVDGLSGVGSKAMDTLKGAGAFIKENKELVSLAGGVANAYTGPDAQANKLRQQQLAQQQSIYDRAMANANAIAPIYSPRLQALRGQGG